MKTFKKFLIFVLIVLIIGTILFAYINKDKWENEKKLRKLFSADVIKTIKENDDTELALSLANSIPTVFLPGIGASILTSFLASARAISLLIFKSLFNLVPD
jgi:hypothetical protein